MSRSDENIRPSEEPECRAVPRAVVRLLRSGLLDQAKTRRVLEIHGAMALEAVGTVKADA
jgi:hypothetical protein